MIERGRIVIGHQVAVFVDAGYFIKGVERSLDVQIFRRESGFSIKNFCELITNERIKFCDSARFLRIYWYDAVRRGESPSAFQIGISEYPNIKLRLGRLLSDSTGHVQKGVDFLLSNDLINLSQHGAISDAILLTGDGDFQKAVETAQNFGVRIHLIGVGNNRKEAQTSGELYEEADTRSFWNHDRLRKLLTTP